MLETSQVEINTLNCWDFTLLTLSCHYCFCYCKTCLSLKHFLKKANSALLALVQQYWDHDYKNVIGCYQHIALSKLN